MKYCRGSKKGFRKLTRKDSEGRKRENMHTVLEAGREMIDVSNLPSTELNAKSIRTKTKKRFLCRIKTQKVAVPITSASKALSGFHPVNSHCPPSPPPQSTNSYQQRFVLPVL